MRLRLFLTVFFVLCLTAASISAIHFHFFKLERLRLIELNLQQNATLLAHAELSPSKQDLSKVSGRLIENIIGDDKVNMIVAIYDSSGRALYMNDNAQIFKVPDHISDNFQEWEDVETKDFFIKYLTTKDPREGRIIRVGMILNQSLIRWKDLNQRIFLYASIILAVIAIISFFLTSLLFRPVRQLAEQVMTMGEKIEQGEFSDLRSWFEVLNKDKRNRDEFQSLIYSLDKLAKKITETQEQTRRWTALMAHELKTPMTILRNCIDQLAQQHNLAPEALRNVEGELQRLEDIITDFLEWASLENDTSRPELHVIPLQKRCDYLIRSLRENYPKSDITFEYKGPSEQRIFCNPIHFDQVVNNLLVNALKYGEGKPLTLEVGEGYLEIADHGPGIPDAVLENFGRPFNKYRQGKIPGYGLGLAWVNTIAKKYNWTIGISNDPGAKIRITIPQLDA